MIRKHATSREFKGNVSTEYGSWNKQRYVMDLQSPLTADGNVRGRIVAGYQNNDSWLDRYNSEKAFFSGIVDADLGTTTNLSAGYEYQKIDVNSPTWAVCRAGTPMAAKIAMTARVVPPRTGLITTKR
ncbi:ferric-rhodotorulic acid outer membrane transporter [Salmonella enterica subsp. enterica]|uniref:Ferric-rhodotorulic acid outer membrane transporter n=1 Tax=Salmonella enterica I TaxID=59201 RepID=A0A447MU17_SALET|nr:ferric-rhodotorulic acid outer membrane transporter [Salmonella enterica subsp. enterica]